METPIEIIDAMLKDDVLSLAGKLEGLNRFENKVYEKITTNIMHIETLKEMNNILVHIKNKREQLQTLTNPL